MTPRKSLGAPGSEKRRFVTGGKASLQSAFRGRYGGFISVAPSITKDGKSSDSLPARDPEICFQEQQGQPSN